MCSAMALWLTALAAALLAVAGTRAAPVKYYATKYDHIDVETILNNRRMVNYYAACLLSRGPCPPEGVEFKRILPEALQTNCARCTEKQKTVTLRTIRRLRKEYPKIWTELSAQWDPDNIYVKKFESTYGTVVKPAMSAPPVVVFNRFGDNTDDDDGVASNTVTQSSSSSGPYPASMSSTTAISTSYTTVSTTTSTTTSTTMSTTPSSTTTTTPKPSTNPVTASTASKPTKRPPVRLRPNIGDRIGANIEATVRIVKAVEQLVAGYAREKMMFINKLFKFNG